MPDADEFSGLRRYRRAADYLTVAQIYLQANCLLAEPVRPDHVKPRLLGHWGTAPGINLETPERIRLRPPWRQGILNAFTRFRNASERTQ